MSATVWAAALDNGCNSIGNFPAVRAEAGQGKASAPHSSEMTAGRGHYGKVSEVPAYQWIAASAVRHARPYHRLWKRLEALALTLHCRMVV